MLKSIDSFLNGITMYRLVMYGLGCIALYALLLGSFGVLAYGPLSLILSLAIVVFACYGLNVLFGKMYRAPINAESSVITAGILFFIISPAVTMTDAWVLVLASLIAMASKYILAFRKRHLFNPAAFAAFIIGMTMGSSVWWVGSAPLLPAVLVVGLLIVRKTRRFHLFAATLIGAAAVLIARALIGGISIFEILYENFVLGPLVFFASVMVTEPATMPPRHYQQTSYGALVGALASWPYVIGPIYSAPEVALLIGNLVAYSVSLRRRLILSLTAKTEVARDTIEFAFAVSPAVEYAPGQYLEWTLPHENTDLRGNRRYFTVASSPTEETIKIGVKFAPNSSSFKNKLRSLEVGEKIMAGSLGGDFVLPRDAKKKLAFLAGGIGVTPFRSMTRFLLDTGTARDIVLLYGVKGIEDIAYTELLEKAAEKMPFKTVYVVAEPPKDGAWKGETGFVTAETVKKYIPDFAERVFYLSGPNAMVDAYKNMLSGLGVKKSNIRSDYFPGFA